MKALSAAVAFLALSSILVARENGFDPDLAKKLGADERGMKMYVLCILKTGPTDSAITGDERNAIFAGHMANIQSLANEGKLAVAVKAGVFVPDLTLWSGSAAMMVVNDMHKRIVKPRS